MSKNKIISSDDIEECESWIIPNVSESSDGAESSLLTASQIEQLQEQAYQEAYEEGLKQGQQKGFESGRQDVEEQFNYFKGMVNSLAAPFQDMDKQVDEELVVLVMSLVRQMIRREIKQDPGQIMAVIREAIESLPVASRKIQLRLHPEDAMLVHDFYKMDEAEQAWQIVEDPLISRGGCKIMTDVTVVDATLETRLSKLFAHVFGERQKDADEE